MLSLILSLSVPSNALQANEDGPTDFAMCPASIKYDQFNELALYSFSLFLAIVNIVNSLLYCFANISAPAKIF